MSPFAAYMICTTPRSGSTLLCRMLDATGVAGHPNSHFHIPDRMVWMARHGLSETAFATDRDALAAVIDAARAKGTGQSGLFGLRMQRGSFEYFIAQLDRLHPGLPSDLRRIERAFGPTAFIHLTRANTLDQAISRLVAEQTGLWHRTASGAELERTAARAPL